MAGSCVIQSLQVVTVPILQVAISANAWRDLNSMKNSMFAKVCHIHVYTMSHTKACPLSTQSLYVTLSFNH